MMRKGGDVAWAASLFYGENTLSLNLFFRVLLPFQSSSAAPKKYFSTPVDNIKKKSIFARLKNLDYYP